MSGLAAVLAGHSAPGLYRWHAAFPSEEVRHTVEHAGWQFAHVDGWVAQSKEELLAAVGEALAFPDHYGRNLDALRDSLTDLVEPVVLLWDGWGPLARSDGSTFATLLMILAERAAARPPFFVLLRGDGPDLELASLD